MSKARYQPNQRALLTDVASLVVDEHHSLEDALYRAARRHGINLKQAQPKIASLRAAIDEYRGLFRPEQSLQLQKHRVLARQAMQEFTDFDPKLVGALVHGDGPLDVIQLVVYADAAEQLIIHLTDRHIPWREGEASMQYSGGRRIDRPVLRFLAGEATIELIVLDNRSHSDPPRDSVSGGKMEMLGVEEIDALIITAEA